MFKCEDTSNEICFCLQFLRANLGSYKLFTIACYTYRLTNTDNDFSFAEQNHPLYNQLGTRSFKGVYLNDERYSGIIINAYHTSQQLLEVEKLLSKTYIIENCRISTRHETWNTLQMLQNDPTKPTQWR